MEGHDSNLIVHAPLPPSPYPPPLLSFLSLSTTCRHEPRRNEQG